MAGKRGQWGFTRATRKGVQRKPGPVQEPHVETESSEARDALLRGCAANPPILAPRLASTHPGLRAEAVARLQQGQGNARVQQLLAGGNGQSGPAVQLRAAPTAAPASPAPAGKATQKGGGTAGSPGMTAEARRRLLYATTTLRRVPELTPSDQKLLENAIAQSPVYSLILEREEKRRQIQQCAEALNAEPKHGPPTEKAEAITRTMRSLDADVGRLSRMIGAALKSLGVSEKQLVALVSHEFPRRFVERGKQIALTELKQNRELAQKEAERYGLRAGQPEARAGLRKATLDLVSRAKEIAQLQQRQQAARAATRAPAGGVPKASEQSSSQYDVEQLGKEITKRTNDLQQQRTAYQVQYPILQQNLDLERVAAANDRELEALVAGPVAEILKNIAKTEENIRDGDLKIWSLRNIVDMTAQDMGIGANPILMEVVNQHIQREKTSGGILNTAIAALAITATIVAAVATGGLSLVAKGIVLAAGAYGAYTTYKNVQQYRARKAAQNVALDPGVAKLCQEEPDLLWLILDVASSIPSPAKVVRVVKQMRKAARALMAYGKLKLFARTAKRILADVGAVRKVIASAARRPGVASAVGATIRAVGREFQRIDVALIKARIERLAGKGFAKVVARLDAERKIRPLTREALMDVYKDKALVDRLIDKEDILSATAVFMPHSDPRLHGYIFAQGGNLNAVSAAVVHEAVHFLQDKYIESMKTFIGEFEAYVMQRAFLTKMAFDLGEQSIPAEWRWLREADDWKITMHIYKEYFKKAGKPLEVPKELDAVKAVQAVLRRVKRFK